jgi:hypothetical protein
LAKSQNHSFLQAVSWGSTHSSLDPATTSLGQHYPFGFFGKSRSLDRQPVQVQQIHGTTVLLDESVGADSEADGIFSLKGCVAVRTADCLPILLGDKKSRLVMALHAGWRGLTQGIIEEGIKVASKNGAHPSSLSVVLGPAISCGCFEVGPEVIEALCSEGFGLETAQQAYCMIKGQEDRWHVDMAMAAVFSLVNLGVLPEDIAVDRRCTVCDEELNSFRREGTKRGNNINWISANSLPG